MCLCHNESLQLITQEFVDNNNCRVEAAERIVVPSGQTWSISQIYMLVAPHSGINKVSVIVYDRSPMGTPGFALYEEDVEIPNTVGSLVPVDLSEQISLFSGIYYISVTPIVDGSLGNVILTYADASSGEEIFIRDPCNIINANPAWARVSESLAYGNSQMHDLAIQLIGVSCTQYEYVTGDLVGSSIHRVTTSLASDAILPSEQFTIFESRKDIDLIPGFTVSNESLFIANVKECSWQLYDLGD